MISFVRKYLANLFGTSENVRKTEQAEMAKMEQYLSQATSLPELENLQRNWDRMSREGSSSGVIWFSR